MVKLTTIVAPQLVVQDTLVVRAPRLAILSMRADGLPALGGHQGAPGGWSRYQKVVPVLVMWRRLCEERLKGLEPSTFCMASGMSATSILPNWLRDRRVQRVQEEKDSG